MKQRYVKGITDEDTKVDAQLSTRLLTLIYRKSEVPRVLFTSRL